MSKLSNSNSDTKDQPPGTPRWVKVCGIIGIVLVLLLVIKMFIGGGLNEPRDATTVGAYALLIGRSPTAAIYALAFGTTLGVALMSLVLGLNLLGDWLRDLLDPKGELNLR
jgi:tellurite resistance protein TehA-like permease